MSSRRRFWLLACLLGAGFLMESEAVAFQDTVPPFAWRASTTPPKASTGQQILVPPGSG